MKTTLELPDKLMRAVKIRAAETDRKLKDVVAELIQRGLESGTPPEAGEDPLEAWARKLVFNEDGSVTNPDGIEDPEFFELLNGIREANRRRAPRDPFADFG
jgi:plasmid stability protein